MEKQSFLDKLESFNEQLNLTHYWIILLKFKRIILLLPIFFGLLGYLVALNILPIFQSNATLVIEQADKNIVNIEEVYNDEGTKAFGNSYNHINNQIQILKSDEVIGGILSNEEVAKKIRKLYSTIPEKFVSRNIKAFKKLIFSRRSDNIIERKVLSTEKSTNRKINTMVLRRKETVNDPSPWKYDN